MPGTRQEASLGVTNLGDMRRIGFVVLFTVAAIATPPAASASQATRLHFLAADTGYLYWSPDAADPELAATSVARTCGIPPTWGTPEAAPCLTGVEPATGTFTHTLFFNPGATLDAPISWTAATQPRFRIALASAALVPYTVHAVVQNGTAQILSPPATQVSPGIYEGELPPGPQIDPAKGTLLGIRIRTPASRMTFQVRAAGDSFIDFATPVATRSVPALLASRADPVEAFETPQRRIEFNDAEHTVHEFSATLTGTRRFSIPLTSRAPLVYAWVESFVDPFLADSVRNGAPDPRRMRDTPVVRLLLDDQVLDSGANGANIRGRGMDTVAGVDVGPGTLTLEVSPSSSSVGGAYTARILIAGERSIARIRWLATPVDNEPYVTHRLPGSAICPAAGEILPVTEEVSTFLVDIDWTTVNPLDEKWTLRYTLPTVAAFDCGEGGVGDRVRFTVPPAARLWPIGAVLPRDIKAASYRMTTFTYDAVFAYTAP